MKDFIFPVLLLLFVILNSCFSSQGNNTNNNPTQTIQAWTQTATSWTATPGPPPTKDTLSPYVYDYLNMEIEQNEITDKYNKLEHINGASYQIVGVDFLPDNTAPTTFRIKIRCECAQNDQCCSPTRTFAVAVMAMDDPNYSDYNVNPDPIITMVPGTVQILEVQTFDHANQTTVMSMPWADVESFLEGAINGFQLWADVTPSP